MREKTTGLRRLAANELKGITPGSQDLPRGIVEDAQRQRTVSPLTELAHEQGLEKTTVAQVLKRARMSRISFYKLFGTRADWMRFAFEETHRDLFAPVQAVCEIDQPWLDRIDGALGAFFDTIAADPLLAEFSLVHSLRAPEEAAGHDVDAAVQEITLAIEGGREAGRKARGAEYLEPSPLAEEFLARVIVSVASTLIRQNKIDSLPAHREELVRLAATPFFGIEEATEIGRKLKAA